MRNKLVKLPVAFGIASALLISPAAAQTVQRLYPGKAPGSEHWQLAENVRTMPNGGKIYTNVVDPEYISFLPEPAKATGDGVIVLPGGGLRALGVGDQSSPLIKRLNDAGIAVFVLKYRVLQMAPQPRPQQPPPSAGPRAAPEWPKFEIRNGNANPSPDDKELTTVLDLATEDAKVALRMIRMRAKEYRIDASRIGMIGTSAGGGVAIAAWMRRGQEEGPSYLASLFGPSLIDVSVPVNAPPLFMATDTDHGPVTDGLVALFQMWREAKRPVEFHSYEVPSSHFNESLWLDRFMAWLDEQKLIGKPAER